MSKQDETTQRLLDLHFGLVGVVRALAHSLHAQGALDLERLKTNLQLFPEVMDCNEDQRSVFEHLLHLLEEPRWVPQLIEGGKSAQDEQAELPSSPSSEEDR